jgi:hypothetical protein
MESAGRARNNPSLSAERNKLMVEACKTEILQAFCFSAFTVITRFVPYFALPLRDRDHDQKNWSRGMGKMAGTEQINPVPRLEVNPFRIW